MLRQYQLVRGSVGGKFYQDPLTCPEHEAFEAKVAAFNTREGLFKYTTGPEGYDTPAEELKGQDFCVEDALNTQHGLGKGTSGVFLQAFMDVKPIEAHLGQDQQHSDQDQAIRDAFDKVLAWARRGKGYLHLVKDGDERIVSLGWSRGQDCWWCDDSEWSGTPVNQFSGVPHVHERRIASPFHTELISGGD